MQSCQKFDFTIYSIMLWTHFFAAVFKKYFGKIKKGHF
jgi:hypothetical protein